MMQPVDAVSTHISSVCSSSSSSSSLSLCARARVCVCVCEGGGWWVGKRAGAFAGCPF